ncbi:hypothetical protein Ocin01_12972 [Orchesella cincta]|uniref:Uncharacterized protein n=1 Tax=Orchesella cincta TaxID=48709 RepID=A0A1D2MKY6_ORCCI|nr:hypothetical protein Ocin01_12972 [Orchesella cincta]
MALKQHRFSLSVDGYRDLKWKAVKVIETKTGEVIKSNEVSALGNEDSGAEAKGRDQLANIGGGTTFDTLNVLKPADVRKINGRHN